MRFYEVYQGEELQATLIVHDDGRKEWEWIRHEWQGSDELQTAVDDQRDQGPLPWRNSLPWCWRLASVTYPTESYFCLRQ